MGDLFQSNALKKRQYYLNDILAIYNRKHLLQRLALEIFYENGSSSLFNFTSDSDRNSVYKMLIKHIPNSLTRGISFKRLYTPSQFMNKSVWTNLWAERRISTFDYLLYINVIAGRSFNDITQYPVFPWIIADYDSEKLDLTNPSTFRDLSKPIGALNPERLNEMLDRYELMKSDYEDMKDIPDSCVEPPFMYGSHYSTTGIVVNYLLRIEPFTTYALILQNGHFDHPDRLFHSIKEQWDNLLVNSADFKELTPEWFYLSDFLINKNELPLGKRQDGEIVSNVVLPKWAKSAEEFISLNREALESDYVSEHINEWIDLIFGYKQTGIQAEQANNVFHYLTYENSINFDGITDIKARQAIENQISSFGQTPSQLLNTPHPIRLSKDKLRENNNNITLFNTSEYATQQVETNHHLPITSFGFSLNSQTLYTMDSEGKLGQYYYNNTKTNIICPFTFEKLGVSHNKNILTSSQMTSEYINSYLFSLDDKNIMIGITGLWDFSSLLLITNPQHQHQQQSLYYHTSYTTCMAISNIKNRYKTNIYLACGSEDTTISIWKINTLHNNFIQSSSTSSSSSISSSSSNNNNNLTYFIDKTPLSILTGHKTSVRCIDINSYFDIVVSYSNNDKSDENKDNLICLIHSMRKGRFLKSIHINIKEIIKKKEIKKDSFESEVSQIKIADSGKILVLVNINEKKSNKLIHQIVYIYTNNGELLSYKELNCLIIPTFEISNINQVLITCTINTIQFRSLSDLSILHEYTLEALSEISNFKLCDDDKVITIGMKDSSMFLLYPIIQS